MAEIEYFSVVKWLQDFEVALTKEDYGSVNNLFLDDCYWRDLVSFTWNIKTMEGKHAVEEMLRFSLPSCKPTEWKITGNENTLKVDDGVIEASFTFETSVSRGEGILRLKNGKCWTILTAMKELKGFEEKKKTTRVMGAEHGARKNRQSWLELKEQEAESLGKTKQPYCIIIGGGQGGIALGARLKKLNVPTIIIEKNERAGDSWRKRYKSLCLHDPVWYDHLPYLPFPDDWPIFSPKDKLADWLEMYVKIMELDYWTSSECNSASYDEKNKNWVVNITRNNKPMVLRPTELIFACGMSGLPSVPTVKGSQKFLGKQHHSSKHAGGEGMEGKKVVVLGANNSSHDICADLWEHGADVTMVQRSTTMIAKSDTLMELSFGLYSEKALANGITTDKADLQFASMPYHIMHTFQIPVCDEIRKKDADFYEKLEKAGFMLDFGDDNSGLVMKYVRRGSGYYIDVGASDLIISGEIKLRSRVGFKEITEHGVILSDDIFVPADVIIYATGYGSMNGWVGHLISQDTADRVGKCWGVGSDTTKVKMITYLSAYFCTNTYR
jgi:putative flavoprotein involved in K+ transport